VKLFNKPVVIHNWEEAEADLLKIASRRVHKMRAQEMVLWADGAASGMMLALEDYMKNEESASLEELTECVITLQAVVKELTERHLMR
jgi:hypothetical protein